MYRGIGRPVSGGNFDPIAIKLLLNLPGNSDGNRVQTGQRHSAPPQSFRRPPLGQGAVQRARHSAPDPVQGRQPERYVVRTIRPVEDPLALELRRARTALYVSAGLLIATAIGSAWFLFGEVGSLRRSIEPLISEQSSRDDGPANRSGNASSTATSIRPKDDSFFARRDFAKPAVTEERAATLPSGETPADIIARGWSALERRSVQSSAIDSGVSDNKSDRLASAMPSDNVAPIAPRLSVDRLSPLTPPVSDPKTVLVEFDTAPFPYRGNIPGSEKPFLDAGEAGRRGHTNFRGRVLREAETFSDRRVLLHIPPRFDPGKPGVIVVFFHGHGANLSDDVRDRQQVPAQISASGVNAVMVAPQFAVNAADSSAGKFWEQDGFKRFLDETAKEFAKLQGDPKAVRAFARMPVVIAAYSGGFGPTLSVLERGGASSRIRGVVLLDALYSGTQKFANWIAANRSAFFVSSYTPHLQRQNAELKEFLGEKSIAIGADLKPNRLPGTVTFLPAGDVSHRDFVSSAWTEYPIKDILQRLDDAGARSSAASGSNTGLFVARR